MHKPSNDDTNIIETNFNNLNETKLNWDSNGTSADFSENKFAVFVLSFNHPMHTQECVQSILGLVSVEWIYLVHNGSESKHIKYLKEQFKNINHIEIEKNLGFTGGVNRSLENCFKKFEWIFFVTNDCKLIELGGPPDRPGLWGPLIYRRKLGKIDSIGAYFDIFRGRLQHCRSVEAFHSVKHNKYIPGTAFWLHKDIYQKIGKFDESLHTYWEDVDYSMRINKAKLELNIDAKTILLHKVGKTCHKDKFYTNYLFSRNRMIVSRRYANLFQRFLLEIQNFLNCPLMLLLVFWILNLTHIGSTA